MNGHRAAVTYTHACTACACHASVASVATGQRNETACQLCMQRSASVCPSARTRTQPAVRVAHASLRVRLPTGQQHDCERWIARLIVEARTPREHTGGSSPTGCGVCAGGVKGCALTAPHQTSIRTPIWNFASVWSDPSASNALQMSELSHQNRTRLSTQYM